MRSNTLSLKPQLRFQAALSRATQTCKLLKLEPRMRFMIPPDHYAQSRMVASCSPDLTLKQDKCVMTFTFDSLQICSLAGVPFTFLRLAMTPSGRLAAVCLGIGIAASQHETLA